MDVPYADRAIREVYALSVYEAGVPGAEIWVPESGDLVGNDDCTRRIPELPKKVLKESV